ncbi:hypothetical protein Syun_006987 [Stephania yunnanensis]|uniref:Uncharacterized protein n=1 Tax=Stephania yunnanensis TaxID=152371 RepID=A0AAP0Q1Y1_9MAGN
MIREVLNNFFVSFEKKKDFKARVGSPSKTNNAIEFFISFYQMKDGYVCDVHKRV